VPDIFNVERNGRIENEIAAELIILAFSLEPPGRAERCSQLIERSLQPEIPLKESPLLVSAARLMASAV
jgi:hypothetical protein